MAQLRCQQLANLTGATSTTYTTATLTDTAYYDVRVTSAAGCRWTAPRVAANVHGLPTATLVSTPASCPGTGRCHRPHQNSGQLPMTYQWSNGASTEDLSNIPSGTYTVTMLDPIGCEGTASITVSDSDGVAPTVYAKDITIALDSLGQASITPADVDSASSDNCTLDLSISDSLWNCPDWYRYHYADRYGRQSERYRLRSNHHCDLTAPQITCGTDTTIYTALDTSGAAYSWAAPTLYDNCGVDTSWSSDSSGAWFAIGTYDIYTYAMDAAGNLDSCSFTLTVADTLAPSFTSCPLDTTMYSDAMNCGANLTWTAPTATDNSDSIFYPYRHFRCLLYRGCRHRYDLRPRPQWKYRYLFIYCNCHRHHCTCMDRYFRHLSGSSRYRYLWRTHRQCKPNSPSYC